MKTRIMKHTRIVIMLFAFSTGTLLTSCSNSAEKVKNAESNVEQAKAELDEANEEYLEDIAEFKERTAERIAANQRSIAAFNKRIASDKVEAKAEYQDKINALEEKNNDMKMKLDNYAAEGKEKWVAFKNEFNRDMDELGDAFTNFFN